MNNLILFGFKACGKSYYGKLFSEKWKISWIDTDQLIEKRFKISGRDVYLKFGEQKFREMEQEIISSLNPEDDCVISLGGGAILQEKNKCVLNKLGKLIYLKAESHVLKNRILSENSTQGMFQGKDISEAFDQMYHERLPLYESVKAHQIDLSCKSDSQVLEIMKEIMYEQ